jgi:hypothetical protein
MCNNTNNNFLYKNNNEKNIESSSIDNFNCIHFIIKNLVIQIKNLENYNICQNFLKQAIENNDYTLLYKAFFTVINSLELEDNLEVPIPITYNIIPISDKTILNYLSNIFQDLQYINNNNN